LERENPFGSFLEHLPQFGNFHPSDILNFVMLWDGFIIFHLAQEDKTYPWEPTLELLLTAEGDKGKAIVIFGRIGLGTDIRIKARHP